MKKLFSIGALVLLLGLFIGTTWFLYQKSQEDPVVHETTQPFRTDIVQKTVAIGTIVPRREIHIKSQVSGVVEELYLEGGEPVREGDLIALIRLIPDMEHLSQARSQLENARLTLRNTEREFERQRRLFERELIPESEFNRGRLERDLQQEAVRAAEDRVSLITEGATASADQTSNRVRATASGMVLDVPVEEGMFVIETNTFNDGTSIALIADMTDLIFQGSVDESEVGKLREGMAMELNIGALEGQTFPAELEYISPKGTEANGTVNFELRAAIELDEGDFLRAGYSANGNIILAQRSDVLAINEGDLVFEEDGTYVEVRTGEQQFEKRLVETGISDGIQIEIVEGLSPDERIKRQ